MITIFTIFYAVAIIFHVEFFLEKSSLSLPVQVKFIPFILAFIAGIIGAVLLHRKDSRINVVTLIETRHPVLKEKLRTAYDNRDETNIVVGSLKSHVSGLLSEVSSSGLLSTGKIISKIVVTLLFISGAYMIQSNPDEYTIPPGKLAGIAKNLTGSAENNATGLLGQVGPAENFKNTGKKGGGEIFGRPKIASIEGKNIDLTLYSGMETGFEVRDVSETGNRFIRSAQFPVDVLGSNVSDEEYSALMKKTEIEKQLINKYAVERSRT